MPSPAVPPALPDGLRYLPGYFDAAAQAALLEAVRDGLAAAPFYRPEMPRTGQPMSVLMTNFGPLGWVTDRARGYRYQAVHPETGQAWPHIPRALLDLWDAVAAWPAPPEACLVNYYDADARMGLHVDSDEDAKDAPVVSVSLGDEAVFRVARAPGAKGPTASFRLRSGDVVVLGGTARHCRHGVDRIRPGTSRLLAASGIAETGRINLTLRRVSRP